MTLYKNTRRLKKHSQGKPRTRIMKGGMKVKYKGGIKYDGDIKDGKANGKGKMTWTDGAVYVGNFKNDRSHGRGKMVWANGEVYEGSYKNGLKDGKGKYTWPDGEFYEGDYRDGMKNGKGKYSWTDGRVYVGEWLDDKKNGRGKMRFLIGAIYDGNWENDQMQTFTPLLQDDDVSNLAFHPSEPLLLSLCRSKNPREPQRLFLQIFDRNHGVLDQKDITESLHDSQVRSIAFHPKAPIFVVGDSNGVLHLFKWEIDLSKRLSVLETSTTQLGGDTQCEVIAFHPSEPLLVTCSTSTVRFWAIKRVKSTNSFHLQGPQCEIMLNDITCIAFHPTRPILITACASIMENTVKLWNYFDYNPSGLSPILLTILSSQPSDEDGLLGALSSDHRSFHSDFVTCVAFHPTEPLFITGSNDTTIKMWRMTPKPLAKGQELWEQSMDATCVTTIRPEVPSPVTCVAFHPTAPLLVGGYNNGNAILWSYIGFLTNKVLTTDPMMYEEYVLYVFPPPPPPVSRRSDDDASDGAAAMMKSSSRVPVSVAASLDFDESPPPAKRLTRAQRNKERRERRERRSELVLEDDIVSAVNFQVDSRGVSFLEIGRRNTNVVELQNVGHFVSAAINTAHERNEQFSSRKEAVQAISDKFKSSTRPNRRQFTAKDVHDAIRRQPVRLIGGPVVEHDKEWEDTLKMREKGDLARSGRRKSSSSSGESKGGYKSRRNNVTKRLRK
jgi:WD40 repeat protein